MYPELYLKIRHIILILIDNTKYKFRLPTVFFSY